MRARRRRGRSLIVFICCRTSMRPLSDSLATMRRRFRESTSILTIVRLRCCFWRSRISASDAVTQTRLMRRGAELSGNNYSDEIRALFEGGSSVGEIAHKLGLVADVVERWVRRIDLPDRNTMTLSSFHPGVFRRPAGTAVGRRHYQSPALVRRDTPSWLYRVLQSSGAFPCTLAQRRAFRRG